MKRFILCLVLYLPAACMESHSAFVWNGQPSPLEINVRVLLKETNQIEVIPSSTYILEVGRFTAMTEEIVNVAHHPKGMLVNGTLVKTDYVNGKMLKSFQYNGDGFRGSFKIVRTPTALQLINIVNLEEYLYSVVPKEIYASWDKETLKAQAIASRSYALHEVKRRGASQQDFDLYSDTRSQVYLGMKTENPSVNRIVNETAGLVLTFNGEIVKSYFHSSSGGSLSAGVEIFDKAPYLQQSASYVAENDPSAFWEHKINVADLQNLYSMPRPIQKVTIQSRFPSGRINKIRLEDAVGYFMDVDAYKVRQDLGYARMKSTLAEISSIDRDGFLVIQGKGYGHGVGMGQWDAEAMAKKGATYDSILAFFYKGSQLRNLY
ncbi:MAG: SpoIID/LytB domain-containing protein [Brevinema sp.]